MGIIDFITSIFKPKKKIHIKLDEESVRTHNKIRALANENAELKAREAKLKIELGKLRESKKDIEEEEEVRWELDKQKNEIKKKVYPKYFSLISFTKELIRNKKFREKLAYYSFDRGTKLANFGDWGFSTNGDFVLLDDKYQVLLKMDKLNDIFQSVAGLGNDVQDGKIPVNLDSEGGYVENIMVWEAPELTPTPDGKFQFTKAKKRKLYEYLNELNEELSEKNKYIEELEITNTQLKKEIDDLSVAQRVAEDSAETIRKELAQAEKSVSAIQRVFRSTEQELSQLRDQNVILEENIEKLENQLENMRSEAEREGSKVNFDRAIEQILQIRATLSKDLPEKEVQIIEKSAPSTSQNQKK